ncbi:MAG: 4Fe-4S binding protein, partial [Deltaproteobacteria bacterium]|nr:4Fe-4S binding protein [Deltaproteobacteria bacterium]
YQRFIDWLKTGWWDLPEAVELMPLIKARYSVEDAALLTGMPFKGHSVEDLAEMKGLDAQELRPKLEELAKKPVIFQTWHGDTVKYSLNDSFFVFYRSSFWRGDREESTVAMAGLVNKYFYHGFMDDYEPVHSKMLRAIPINRTVEDTKTLLPYEDVVKLIEDVDYLCVSTCACRHRKNIDPEYPECGHPDEVCLHFDTLARFVVNNGMGREITREEAYEILKKSADSGLVHSVGNSQANSDTICNCCKCCCQWFEAYYRLGHSRSVDPSNYLVEVTPETCKGCALCVKRCPMDALQLRYSRKAANKFNKAPELDTGLCIGCGVCVHKCPTESIRLSPKDTVADTPKDFREYLRRFDEASGRV